MEDLWTYEVLNESGIILTEGGPCSYEAASAAMRLTIQMAKTEPSSSGHSDYLANGEPCTIRFVRVGDGKVMTEVGESATCQ